MPLRTEEDAAINDLLAFLSRQRGAELKGREGPDPPDWLAEDPTMKGIIAIEHTRVITADIESTDRWKELCDLAHERAAGKVPGVFLVGQARPGQRFPTTKRVPLDPIAQKIVDAIAQRRWSAPYETWEVSPTQAPLPKYWVKVMYVQPEGSAMWGLPPFGRRNPQVVIEWLRGTLAKKATDLTVKAPDAQERILLVDVTEVHPARLGACEEHAIDVMETMRHQSGPTPTAVYFRGKTTGGQIEIRLIWPPG